MTLIFLDGWAEMAVRDGSRELVLEGAPRPSVLPRDNTSKPLNLGIPPPPSACLKTLA